MKTANIQIDLKHVVMTPSGAGVFLGNDQKTFVIYVDLLMGEQIRFAFEKKPQPRPLTFDFVRYLIKSFEIETNTIVIYKAENGVFFSRVVFYQPGPMDRVVEMDLRTSDAILLSLSLHKPIYIDQGVLNKLPDATEILSNFKRLNK